MAVRASCCQNCSVERLICDCVGSHMSKPHAWQQKNAPLWVANSYSGSLLWQIRHSLGKETRLCIDFPSQLDVAYARRWYVKCAFGPGTWPNNRPSRYIKVSASVESDDRKLSFLRRDDWMIS